MTTPRILQTRRGPITLPTFFPVTTFGDTYPLDRLIRPYLPRLAQAVLVSHHYAKPLAEHPADRPAQPMFIDSGGFALLFDGSRWETRGDTSVIITTSGDTITPQEVLQQQMDLAEIGATVDLPIPPGTDPAEAVRRRDATIANAAWALQNNRRQDLPLYASLQCWDATSARESAQAYAAMSFHGTRFAGIAIGGLVPRARDDAYLQSVVEAVRAVWDGPIHVFGIGNPTTLRKILGWGADSADSSSYVKYAADGKHLNPRIPVLPDGARTPLGLMNLALRNLAHLLDPLNDHVPLSVAQRSRMVV
jgi:tRNA-guanine family transglycosylase